jgi:hypothetical protein
MVNGLVTAHAKASLQEYDDQKTPARSPSSMSFRAVRPEEPPPPPRADIKQAFDNSVSLMKKKP